MHKARMVNKEITKGKKVFCLFICVFVGVEGYLVHLSSSWSNDSSMKPTHVLLTIATRPPLKPDRPPICLFNRMFLWEPIRSKLATRM